MNPEHRLWVVRLLYVLLLLVIGIPGVVSARGTRERSLLRGLLGQGILMTIVVSAVSFPERTELKLAGMVAVTLLIIQECWAVARCDEDTTHEQEHQPS